MLTIATAKKIKLSQDDARRVAEKNIQNIKAEGRLQKMLALWKCKNVNELKERMAKQYINMGVPAN